jgi:hypothetical protein
MSAEDGLLRANAAFYDAFAGCDIEAMDELWSRRLPVACIHPGWPALQGREDVMSSWRSILLGEGSPEISCWEARAALLGEVGYVVCLEQIGPDALAATNVFALEDGVWQLVLHQAGGVALEAEAPGRRLN